MNISELIQRLQAIQAVHGDLPVMYRDGDGDSVWGLFSVKHEIAEEDEYPEDWDMPQGFEFVLLAD